MQNYLEKGKQYKIIPESVEDVTLMTLYDYDDNFLFFNDAEFHPNFKENTEVELFSEISEGLIYSKANVIYLENDVLKLSMPENFEILQRRKSERWTINSNILIDIDGENVEVLLQDLSVDGIKILTNKQLVLNKNYIVKLNFDNIDLTFYFTPLRLTAKDDMFVASGTLTTINKIDKIELIQYCYNKKFEKENRQ